MEPRRWLYGVLLGALTALSACEGCSEAPTVSPLKPEGLVCAADGECETGMCEALPGDAEAKCIRLCVHGCRQNEHCQPLASDRFACVPEREGLCGECQTDADCPYPADRCIVVGGARVCGRDCSWDGKCPDSFTCAEAVDVNGDLLVTQCQPASGTCACTADSHGQTLPCEQTNSFGSCTGVRTCSAGSGYSACSARIPAEEICDGLDNDCNGQVDEGLGVSTCGVGECLRTIDNCIDGQPTVCVPRDPGVEVCDERDNDCDGQVDEDWDKQTSVLHCGACNNNCAAQLTAAQPHGEPDCQDGACAMKCDTGWGNCDALYPNGCEQDLLSNLQHCGGCFLACAPANTRSATCNTGVCTGECMPDWDNCDLDWSNGCEANLRTDMANCGACGSTCPVRPNATSHCTDLTCGFTCEQNWWDADGDPSNGCEYQCVFQSAVDVPDLQFIDANCDGIDGEVGNAIFVAPHGDDNNPGSMQAPKRTLNVGLAAAASSGSSRPQVYVAAGSYLESLNIISGVGIYGGYDPSTRWSRSPQNVSHLQSPTAIAVTAQGLAHPTDFQLMSVTAADASGTSATGDGNSSIGILVVNSGATLTIAGCTVTAGEGAPGALGVNGGVGAPGVAGGNAGLGNVYNPGVAGASSCGSGGGAGASGVSGLRWGNAGATGSTAVGGGDGAIGGTGGAPGQCGGISSEDGHPAPTPGLASSGNPGINGLAGSPLGVFDNVGHYVPASGGTGSVGRAGGGGGGGGSGGGSAHGTSVWDACGCTNIWSGGGGGGGGGGCGGQPGSGGRGGGGSFGIAAVNAAVSVIGTTVHSGKGGNGGIGGSGGQGGAGGSGGVGSSGQHSSSSCSTRRGGRGADGTTGGTGGRGGGASGGAGGPSICIVYRGTQPHVSGHTCTNGQPGTGGAGGTNGFQQASTGAAGIAQALQAVP